MSIMKRLFREALSCFECLGGRSSYARSSSIAMIPKPNLFIARLYSPITKEAYLMGKPR